MYSQTKRAISILIYVVLFVFVVSIADRAMGHIQSASASIDDIRGVSGR